MIRFIVKTVSSRTDVNGNRYHFATITSTKTGKYINLDSVGGDSNAHGLVRKLLDTDWEEIYSTNQSEMVRDWQRMNKWHKDGLYEHQVTAVMLRKLERKTRSKSV
jgi:hypothetical protein